MFETFKNKLRIEFLKHEIIETMGRIEFNQDQLAIAKNSITNAKQGTMTFNELSGTIEFMQEQLAGDRPRLEQMQQEWKELHQ